MKMPTPRHCTVYKTGRHRLTRTMVSRGMARRLCACGVGWTLANRLRAYDEKETALITKSGYENRT